MLYTFNTYFSVTFYINLFIEYNKNIVNVIRGHFSHKRILNNDIITQESYNGMRAKQLFYCCFSFGQRILDNNDVWLDRIFKHPSYIIWCKRANFDRTIIGRYIQTIYIIIYVFLCIHSNCVNISLVLIR